MVCGSSGSGITEKDGIVVRYNSNGSLDPSFNTDGIYKITIGHEISLKGIDLQDDEKIVVSGRIAYDYPTHKTLILRLSSDGYIDESFNSTGYVISDIYDDEESNNLVIQDDGKIVTIGTGNYSGERSVIMALRYNTDGTADESFGYSGYIGFADDYDCLGYDVTCQPDDKLLLSGKYGQEDYSSFVIIRLNPDGFPDTDFGVNGWAITPFDFTQATARSIILQEDGKLLAAGLSLKSATNLWNMAIARYHTGLYTSINEQPATGSIHVYPNPSNGDFSLTISEPLDYEAELFIYDISGKLLWKDTREMNKPSVHVKDIGLNNGLYLIKVSLSNTEAQSKLIINK